MLFFFGIKSAAIQVRVKVVAMINITVNSLISDHPWFAAKWSLTGGGRLWEK